MPGIDLRAAKITWTVILIALLLFGTYLIRFTLLIAVLSVFFAYLVLPLVQIVERYKPRRMPRSVMIAFAYILVIAIVALAIAVFGSRIVEQAVRLEQQLPVLLDANNISQRVPLPRFLEPERARLLNLINEGLRISTDQALPLAKQIGAGLMHTVENLIYVVIVPILSFLLIKDGPQLRTKILSWLDRPNSPLWAGIIEELNGLLASYVRALLLLALATFVSYSIVLSISGAPYSLLLGGIAGLLEVIPVFGPLTAIVVILAVSVFSGYPHLGWLIAFFLAYRIFQDYVLGPYVMSEGVAVSAPLVIIGLLAGEQLAGIAGIFLAVPVMAAMKIFFVRIQGLKKARIDGHHEKDENNAKCPSQ